MPKRPDWSQRLPRPITIPEVTTLKTLLACAAGEDPANISVVLQLVLQAERGPYTTGNVAKPCR